MSKYGPKRIIMINSGKYGHAEVEIDDPVYLVGSNNAGKTTLIAILQYLYIDDERSMSYGEKDITQTKNYYFKGPYSYVLFECLTSQGYKVIGVRGTGRKGERERFVYSGIYKKEHFVKGDGVTIRSGDEVKLELSAYDYTALKSHELRAALTGTSNNKGLSLDLLPIKNTESYITFRKTYHNLLNLSTIAQDELKELLIHVCESSFSLPKGIDLNESYSANYEEILRLKKEISIIQSLAPTIENCLTLYEEREQNRSDLVAGYSIIKNRLSTRITEIGEQIIEIIETCNELETEKEQTKNLIEEIEDEISIISKELWQIQAKIKTLEETGEKFKDYAPVLSDGTIAALTVKIDKLNHLVSQAKVDKVEIVEARINKSKKSLMAAEGRFKNIKYSVATHLKKHFTDQEITLFFSLYNESILQEKIDNSSIIISDQNLIKERIKIVLSRIKGHVYSDDAVTIPLNSLEPKLKEYTDAELIKEDIEFFKNAIIKDEHILEAAKEKENLEAKKVELEREKFRLQTEKEEYGKYLTAKEYLPEDKSEEHKKKDLKNERVDKKKSLNEKLEKISIIFSKEKQKKDELERERQKLIPMGRDLRQPDSTWVVDTDYDFDHEFFEIEELVENHKLYALSEESQNKNLISNLRNIDAATYSKYSKTTEAETLKRLKIELESIVSKEETALKLWDGLLVGIGAQMKYLINDLETLKSTVGKYSRELSKIGISDLSGFKIKVDEKIELTSLMQKVIDKANPTLFTKIDEDAVKPMKMLSEHFQSRGKIVLSDLFSLVFEVIKADGDVERYTSLKSVESNGTTTTIKVLVNLILMKGLLDSKKEVLIPFFLDEITTLDHKNATAIINQSLELGFTPIVASPEPMYIVDKIYFLSSGGNQLIVDDNNLGKFNDAAQ
jgi:hypothetical protein